MFWTWFCDVLFLCVWRGKYEIDIRIFRIIRLRHTNKLLYGSMVAGGSDLGTVDVGSSVMDLSNVSKGDSKSVKS